VFSIGLEQIVAVAVSVAVFVTVVVAIVVDVVVAVIVSITVFGAQALNAPTASTAPLPTKNSRLETNFFLLSLLPLAISFNTPF
jgi:hypothetical protein